MTDNDPTYPLFPTDEYGTRIDRARALMDQFDIDALLVSSKQNAVYFSGIRTIGWMSNHRPLAVLVPRDAAKPVHMILPSSLLMVADQSSWISDLILWGDAGDNAHPDPIAAIQHGLETLGLIDGRIGLENGYGHRVGMAQVDHSRLLDGLPKVTISDASQLLWELRMIKSDLEVDALRKVCDATSKAFERGFSEIREGMTERELAGIIMAELSYQTHETAGFVMVRSGPEKYAMINCEAFEKPLNRGDLVVVDVGGTYKYYWSDFMRMACIGSPSAAQATMFQAELIAQQAGIDCIKPGITLSEIYAASYDSLVNQGLEEHLKGRMARIGHGVGMDMHEHPSITPDSDIVTQPNMVLTVEPIWWDLPDHNIGNFALEDMVLVTDDGHEVLSLYPKELHIAD